MVVKRTDLNQELVEHVKKTAEFIPNQKLPIDYTTRLDLPILGSPKPNPGVSQTLGLVLKMQRQLRFDNNGNSLPQLELTGVDIEYVTEEGEVESKSYMFPHIPETPEIFQAQFESALLAIPLTSLHGEATREEELFTKDLRNEFIGRLKEVLERPKAYTRVKHALQLAKWGVN